MSEALRVVVDTPRPVVPVGGRSTVGFGIANPRDVVARFRVRPVEPRGSSGAVFRFPEQPFRLGPGASTRVLVELAIPPTIAVDTFEIRLDVTEDEDTGPTVTHGPIVTVVVTRPGTGPHPTVVVCPTCGHENPSDDDFCAACGTFLGWAAAPSTTTPPPPSRRPVMIDDDALPPPSAPDGPPPPMRLPDAPPPSYDLPTAAAPPPPPPMSTRGRAGGILDGLVDIVGGILTGGRNVLGGPDDAAPPAPRTRGRPADRRVRVPSTRPAPMGSRRTVERTTSATFPPQVAAEDTARLDFAIGDVLVGGVTGAIRFAAPADVPTVDLVATVHAPAFDIVEPVAAGDGGSPTVEVKLDLEDPASAARGTFYLRARSVDAAVETAVLLDFWHRASPVGQITVQTRVVPAGTPVGSPSPVAPAAVGEFRVSAVAPPPADVTLSVTDEGGGRYVIHATTARFFMRELGAFPAGQNAWGYAKALLERFRDASDLPDAVRVDRVMGLGLDLWRNLPAGFHDFYAAELQGRDLSIAIYSQEPYIPWELVRPPTGDGLAGGFLGADFRVARWRNGRLFPDPLTVRDFVVIAPEYPDEPLVQTAVEAAALVDRFHARVVDGTYEPVATSLRSSATDMVHFAGHGLFDDASPQQSSISLTDVDLVPTDIRTFREGIERGPFVFLNACEVGEQGWALTGIGGWADTFCDERSVGFVGPYWAVDDEVARLAAVRFYAGLAAGMSVGAAIRDVRRGFDEPGPHRHSPTWLAYSLHCQPNLRIDLRA